MEGEQDFDPRGQKSAVKSKRAFFVEGLSLKKKKKSIGSERSMGPRNNTGSNPGFLESCLGARRRGVVSDIL